MPAGMSFFEKHGSASARLDHIGVYENGYQNANGRSYGQSGDVFDDEAFENSHVTRPRTAGRTNTEYQRRSPVNAGNSRVVEEGDLSQSEFEEPYLSQRQKVPLPTRNRPQRISPTSYNNQEINASSRSIFDTASGRNFGTNAGYSQTGTSYARSAGTNFKPTPWDFDGNADQDIAPNTRQRAPTREPPKQSPLSNMNSLRDGLPDSEPNIFDNANGADDWGEPWEDIRPEQPTRQGSSNRRPTEQRVQHNDFGDNVDNRGGFRTATVASSNPYYSRNATGSNAIPLSEQTSGYRSANGARNRDGDKKVRREKFMPVMPSETELFDDVYGIKPGDQIEKISSEVAINGGDGKGDKVKINNFDQMGLSPEILKNLYLKKIKSPMPIQKYVIPLVLKNQHYPIIGNAETGSGKTIAFLVPIIHTIQQMKRENSRVGHPYALIIEPTRELANQLNIDARTYSINTGVKVELLIGETPMRESIQNMEKGCDILVATLGRLRDFIERRYVSLDNLRYLVLDEADRLLKGDNVETIEYIKNLSTIKEHRTLLFSATYDEDLQLFLSESNLIDQEAYFISVGNVNCVAKTIDQRFIEVHRHDKPEMLLRLLRDAESTEKVACQSLIDGEDEFTYKPEKAIVFVNQKRASDMVAMELAQRGFNVISLNADRTAQQRWDAINKFQRGMYDVLVATDVAARGLNIPKVDHVINFDLPRKDNLMQYNHRIGRTGRAGNVGHATSFFDSNGLDVNSDVPNIKHYVECLRQVNQTVPEFMAEIARQQGLQDFEMEQMGLRNRSTDWDR
ncbi:DEAD/DEAH box helicase domain-containing protein [Ditylenchus destructor]|uniref:RNA helicase n=1 Tax=Ditylenchus destructor TaxID=166010 RepID=A0AAD4N8S2_9BILA|nr:DEAD/DEAH box helicase domain-containing protein [Ditylenchus destructor]